MNRRIKKKIATRVAENLAKYVGKNIIRTKPTKNGDWSYTDGEPIKFLGIDKTGKLHYQYTGKDTKIFGNGEFVLSRDFVDENWILFQEAINPQENNPLNKWIGKKIKRICPTEYGDKSYMCAMSYEYPVTLISASRFHVFIEYNNPNFKGEKKLLNPRMSKTEDWVLAE